MSILESRCVITHRNGNHYRVRTKVEHWVVQEQETANPVDTVQAMRSYLSMPKEKRDGIVIIPFYRLSDQDKVARGLGVIRFDQSSNSSKFIPFPGNEHLCWMLDQYGTNTSELLS